MSATGEPVRGALPAGLGRDELVSEVARVLNHAVAHAASVVLAVSGGPDSTAMAYLVTEARPDLHASIAHVRHGLRQDDADAAAAAAHATALGLPYHQRDVRVRPAGSGPEAAAREARYAALVRIARRQRASCVLVGHTADDQAETLLLNLARGTGIRGLAGMAAVRVQDDVRVVRPLLRLRRSDVRGFVVGEGLQAVSDPTNASPEQRRARVRQRVLPALAQLGGGPGDPVPVLTRLADLARDDADALDTLGQAQARRLVVRWGPVRAAPLTELRALPPAIAGRVVRLLLAGVRGRSEGLTAEAVGAILALEPGQALHAPGGVWVTSGGGWVAAAPADAQGLAARPLAVPGVTPLPEIGRALCADLPWGELGSDHLGQGRLELGLVAAPHLDASAAFAPAPLGELPPRSVGLRAPPWVVLPAGAGDGLAVRARRPGDRMRLARGSRKVQDLLVDHGVPRAVRDLVPVVVDAGDEPVWIPGVAARVAPGDSPAGVRLWLAPEPLG